MRNLLRREFLKSTATTACSAGLSACGLGEFSAGARALGSALATPTPAPLPIKKGLVFDMLPAKLSCADRMKLAHDVGFEVVQAPTTPDEKEAEEIKKAADGANIRIDSVMNMDHWKYPLSSSDATVVEKSMAGLDPLRLTPPGPAAVQGLLSRPPPPAPSDHRRARGP